VVFAVCKPQIPLPNLDRSVHQGVVWRNLLVSFQVPFHGRPKAHQMPETRMEMLSGINQCSYTDQPATTKEGGNRTPYTTRQFCRSRPAVALIQCPKLNNLAWGECGTGRALRQGWSYLINIRCFRGRGGERLSASDQLRRSGRDSLQSSKRKWGEEITARA
jgi:hypothetical protein